MQSQVRNVTNFTAGTPDCKNDFVIPTLTLAQVKQLRRVQKDPKRSQALNGIYPIQTLSETITFIRNGETQLKSLNGIQQIGIFIEIMEYKWYST